MRLYESGALNRLSSKILYWFCPDCFILVCDFVAARFWFPKWMNTPFPLYYRFMGGGHEAKTHHEDSQAHGRRQVLSSRTWKHKIEVKSIHGGTGILKCFEQQHVWYVLRRQIATNITFCENLRHCNDKEPNISLVCFSFIWPLSKTKVWNSDISKVFFEERWPTALKIRNQCVL